MESKMSFENPYMLKADAIAEKIMQVAENLDAFSKRARNRVLSKFDAGQWYARHEEVFRCLLGKGKTLEAGQYLVHK